MPGPCSYTCLLPLCHCPWNRGAPHQRWSQTQWTASVPPAGILLTVQTQTDSGASRQLKIFLMWQACVSYTFANKIFSQGGKKNQYLNCHHENKALFCLFWSRHAVCGILLPPPGIKPRPSAMDVQSLNHWTTREFPKQRFL